MDILIVEDEMITAEFIQKSLASLGFTQSKIVDNADDCEALMQHRSFDLILMDINIKGPVDGIVLARKLSLKYKSKIIFITSYGDIDTIDEATQVDPIHYLIKPIVKKDLEIAMLIAKAQITSQTQSIPQIIKLDNIVYDTKQNGFMRGGVLLKLSRLETKALKILIQNKNVPVLNQTLIDSLWSEPRSMSALRELISRLRKKLPELKLENHSNVGYIVYES
jgi:DNA-binding response OmpR family regulator